MYPVSQLSVDTLWLRRLLPFLLVLAMGSVGAAPLHSHSEGKDKNSPSGHLLKQPHGKARHDKDLHHKGKHKEHPAAFKLGFNPRTLQTLSPTEIERVVPSRGQKRGGK